MLGHHSAAYTLATYVVIKDGLADGLDQRVRGADSAGRVAAKVTVDAPQVFSQCLRVG